MLIGVCIASGLVEVFGGYGVIWRLSRYRYTSAQPPRDSAVRLAHTASPAATPARIDLSRRTLLRTGALAAGVARPISPSRASVGLGICLNQQNRDRLPYVPANAIPATIWLDQVPTLGPMTASMSPERN